MGGQKVSRDLLNEEIERIRKKCQQYQEKVRLFFFFKKKIEKNKDFVVGIEPKITKVEGDKKEPDIFVQNFKENLFTAIEHKGTRSKDTFVLKKELEDILGYLGDYTLPNQDKQVFVEVVGLVHESSSKIFVKLIASITPKEGSLALYKYSLNEHVSSKKIYGKISDGRLMQLLEANNEPLPDDVFKYQLVRSRPPLPYLVVRVYQIILALQDPLSPKSPINYDIILEAFNSLYPPWIAGLAKGSEDRAQLTKGELNKALVFLEDLKILKWDKGRNQIFLNPKKYIRAPDFLGFFIRKSAELELKRRGRLAQRKKGTRYKKTTSLEKFL